MAEKTPGTDSVSDPGGLCGDFCRNKPLLDGCRDIDVPIVITEQGAASPPIPCQVVPGLAHW